MDIIGIELQSDHPLDGVSLLPLFQKQMDKRPNPMGFWHYPAAGIRTPSAEWMTELLEAQQRGNMVGDSTRLRIADIRVDPTYSQDSLPGHAAWLDWPWKLHRIQDKPEELSWELYDLSKDSMETENLYEDHPDRVAAMQVELVRWQKSVIRSLNGEDYHDDSNDF